MRESVAKLKILEALEETGLTPLGQSRLLSEILHEKLGLAVRRQGAKVERSTESTDWYHDPES